MNCGAWFNVKELGSSLRERQRERERERKPEREKGNLLVSADPRNKQL